MELLNGLSYVRKTTLEWHSIRYVISNTIGCESISIKNVERMEDDICIYFDILDKTKKKEIKESLLKFCNNIKLDQVDVFDEIDYVCDNEEDEYGLNIDDSICLNILSEYLKDKYDSRINVVGIEACYENVGILFEIKE